ncbi:MAG: hypothetical protein AMS22_04200 [Thiotrichales bacterium SG8_50]|nr:MAG: hypothetical protein AMS22_04200 [Thiotrichales bacterium SG8_50]
MCGRYTVGCEPSALIEHFEPDEVLLALRPRYNVAPSQSVAILRCDEQARKVLAPARWGLIPSWAKDPAIGNRMINARAETVADKPAFRTALRRRRCLVAADGFYEWRKLGAAKQPYWIGLATRTPMGFAGLWERWQPSHGGDALESCTIITTAANEVVAPIHERMPVVLRPSDYARWLNPATADVAELTGLLMPYPDAGMIAYPVSTAVNSPRNDDPSLREPLDQG